MLRISRTISFAAVLLLAAGCGSESSPWSPSQKKKSESAEKSPIEKSKSVTVLEPKVDTSDPDKPTWDPNGVADFSLIERSGKTVKRADLLGKPWVVCFIFTHCAGPCSDISGQMYQLQSWLKQNEIADVRLVTVTVDPKRDTPAVMQRYSENFGADKDRWLFLTGDEAELYKLIKTSFGQPVYQQTGDERKKGFEVFHTSSVMLVDAKGKIVEEYNGKYPTSMLQLRKRIRDWKDTGTFNKPDDAGKKPATKTNTGGKP